MSIAVVVTADGWVDGRATDAQTILNAASVLHLYHASINPTPGTALATFQAQEATFDTYAPQTLSGSWAVPIQLATGEWETVQPTVSFSPPISAGDTIYGLWVDDGAGNLILSYELSTPIMFSPTSGTLLINLGFIVWARSILP